MATFEFYIKYLTMYKGHVYTGGALKVIMYSVCLSVYSGDNPLAKVLNFFMYIHVRTSSIPHSLCNYPVITSADEAKVQLNPHINREY